MRRDEPGNSSLKRKEHKKLKRDRAFKLSKEHSKRTPEEQLEIIKNREGAATKETNKLEKIIFARDLFKTRGYKKETKHPSVCYMFTVYDDNIEKLMSKYPDASKVQKENKIRIRIRDTKLFHYIDQAGLI